MIRRIVSFIVILPLLIVPLFCCCIQKAEAATVGMGHCHDDDGDAHSAKHDESKADHDHACNCGHTSSSVLENISTSQISFLFAHSSFPAITFIKPISIVLLKGSSYPTYLGPPGSSSAVPLYTLYHSLRI